MMDKPPIDADVESIDEILWRHVDRDDAHAAVGEVIKPEELEPKLRQVGPYMLVEQIGRGAFGTVFRARESRRDFAEVAVKILDGRMATPEAELRFRREIKIAASLDHPNISSIIDHGVHDGVPYIVMRLIRGLTLREKIDEDGTCSPAEAARIAERLAIAIAHAHSRNVIHRDLKPSNVILEMGDPIVVDLGLSKSLIASDSFTGKGDLLGSPLFMAPEQLFGEKADERSDIFGIGGLLYFLLTGKTPRKLEEFRKRLTPTPWLPRDVPVGLANICQKALADKPGDRFQNAQELARTLSAWQSGREITMPVRAVDWKRTSGLSLIIGIGLGVYFYGGLAANYSMDLAKNKSNTYSIEDHEILVKDGRSFLNSSFETTFPCLKVAINGRETWSPPAQRLVVDRVYFLGHLVNGLLLAKFQFVPGSGPIHGQFAPRVLNYQSVEKRQLTMTRRGAQFYGETDLGHGKLQLSGAQLSQDATGMTWGHQAETQLIATFNKTRRWSPPRPMDRTEFGQDYPLCYCDQMAVTGQFTATEDRDKIVVKLIVYRVHDLKSNNDH